MKYFISSLALAGLVCLAACSSSTKVTREPQPIVGLSNTSIHFVVDNTRELPLSGTYDWGFALYRVEKLPGVNLAAVDKLIHESLQAALAKKGFVVTGNDPEYLVSFALTSGAELDESILNAAHEDAAQPLPIASGNADQPLHYRRGALVVDLVVAKTKHLLWRGAIMADVDLTLSEAQKRARCEGAVNELLQHYPKP